MLLSKRRLDLIHNTAAKLNDKPLQADRLRNIRFFKYCIHYDPASLSDFYSNFYYSMNIILPKIYFVNVFFLNIFKII